MGLYELEGRAPKLAPGVFVADSAAVIGRVTLGKDANVWFGAVIRGDLNEIEIGEGVSVQDNAVIHVDPTWPCRIGNRCTIAHNVTLHGCELGDEVLVGMNAVVLNGAKVGERSVIGSGAVVRENMQVPPRSLVLGIPAKAVKELDAAKAEFNRVQAEFYVQLKEKYLHGAFKRL